MFIMRFTERPYVAYTEDEVRGSFRSSVRLTFPNAHFNPELGADLYNEYLDEYEFSEEVGFDGLMLNEHHNTPTCMGAAMNLEAAILARITKQSKIVLLGNPLPIFDNPIRLAEELAEIDMISRGRLVSGFVRGTGIESWATNTNPVHNRERFEEAHDVILAAWTRPGPFRWEGKHFQYRVINPWALPLQKPHPPIMVPGTASPETVVWAAQHRYPYIVLGSFLEQTQELIQIYRETAEAEGYEMQPEHIGYLIRCFVADSHEKAQEQGKNFFWQNGALNKQPREWMAPPGYATVNVAGIRRLRAISRSFDSLAYAEAQKNYQLVVGTPDQVIEKLRYVRDLLGVGHLFLWSHDGYMSHEDTVRCIELMGKEVLPALHAA